VELIRCQIDSSPPADVVYDKVRLPMDQRLGLVGSSSTAGATTTTSHVTMPTESAESASSTYDDQTSTAGTTSMSSTYDDETAPSTYTSVQAGSGGMPELGAPVAEMRFVVWLLVLGSTAFIGRQDIVEMW